MPTLSHSAAYPSGHATFGYLDALVLAQMVPEKRAAIFARAGAFARNRVLCGVHYSSDVEAGKIAGFVIGAALFGNRDFKIAFEPAKDEVRKALGLPPIPNK